MCIYQVTVPGELAAQVVSALGDLHRVKARAHSERLQQLLEKTQEIVFADIAPYWGTFCAQYTSPDGSTISIPCGSLNLFCIFCYTLLKC